MIPERKQTILGFPCIFCFDCFPGLVLEMPFGSHVRFKIVLADVVLANLAVPILAGGPTFWITQYRFNTGAGR